MTEIDLDALSKGSAMNNEAKILLEKATWNNYPTEGSKAILSFRKKTRRSLFKVLKYIKLDRVDELDIEHQALKEIFEQQLQPNLAITWEKFTFTWDLHPKRMTEIILTENWFNEGGVFDEIGRHAPTAFTKQVI